MKKFFLGLIIGIFLSFILIYKLMPRLMFNVHTSKYSFSETVYRLENSILKNEWDIQRIYDIGECLANYNYENYRNVIIFSICKADNVNAVLEKDEDRKITAMMPCRIGVYETDDGDVKISSLNMSLMSRLFGSRISKIMQNVYKDERRILSELITN
ncbi:MAG: DUF302 domain-containing protein [Candidatus Cloacimonetes bacterium]|nr:DUF302 domain-containing protein [Candidatus Cloacimonadota bacterium]